MDLESPICAASAATAVERAIVQMDRWDDTLRAVITRLDDDAREQARRSDEAMERGEWFGSLHGWTVALKDNIATAGVRTTSGSRFFEHHVPDVDAFVADRLRRAGVIVTSKVNLAEFALGATTHNDRWGTCRNAWNPRHIPGGSSGGSAVAVAAGMARASLGTDTGGSVRLPAAMNGLVGVRPTLGRISNRGVTPISAAFDTVGPIARTAQDAAQIYTVIDGYDPLDPTCLDHERVSVLSELSKPVDGLRVGVPRRFFFDGLDPAVEHHVREFVQVLERLGCLVKEVDMPGADQAQDHMFRILYPDAAAFHRKRMEQEPQMFGPEVLDRLRLGEGVDARDMSDSLSWRRSWQRLVGRVLDDVDVVVTPAMPEDVPLVQQGQMIVTTHSITRFTYPWAMFHGPSLSVPCGLHEESGLPVGAHLTGRPWSDHVVLRVAHAFQQVTGFHRRVSPLVWASEPAATPEEVS